MSDGEDEGGRPVANVCPICLDPWGSTKNHSHQLSSLECGHLFGFSCIEKALRNKPRGASAKCPVCGEPASPSKIRRLFAPSTLATKDTSVEKGLQAKCTELSGVVNRALIDNQRLQLRLTALEETNARLRADLLAATARAKRSRRETNLPALGHAKDVKLATFTTATQICAVTRDGHLSLVDCTSGRLTPLDAEADPSVRAVSHDRSALTVCGARVSVYDLRSSSKAPSFQVQADASGAALEPVFAVEWLSCVVGWCGTLKGRVVEWDLRRPERAARASPKLASSGPIHSLARDGGDSSRLLACGFNESWSMSKTDFAATPIEMGAVYPALYMRSASGWSLLGGMSSVSVGGVASNGASWIQRTRLPATRCTIQSNILFGSVDDCVWAKRLEESGELEEMEVIESEEAAQGGGRVLGLGLSEGGERGVAVREDGSLRLYRLSSSE